MGENRSVMDIFGYMLWFYLVTCEIFIILDILQFLVLMLSC